MEYPCDKCHKLTSSPTSKCAVDCDEFKKWVKSPQTVTGLSVRETVELISIQNNSNAHEAFSKHLLGIRNSYPWQIW